MQTPRAAVLPAPATLALTAFWSRHADLLLLSGLTLLAAVLRLWQLGDIPQGIHGDEAQVGMDARRVLEHGWIGPYTPAALGQPAGHAYLTAPAIALFGSTAWSVRLPLALTGIAAVPLAYGVFRLHAGRLVAAMAAFLLAVSLWHLHYSRVAHWPISYVTVGLAVLLLWTLAMQRGQWRWFLAAGALLGLGLYTYNVYPIFVIAFAVCVGLYTLLFKRGAALRDWLLKAGAAAAVSVIVGLPLFLYMADPANDYFNHYRGYYQQYSVLQSDAYKNADFSGRVDIVADKTWSFLGAYAWQGIPDFIDATSPDRRPMLDKLSLALIVGGVVYAAWRWRETAHLMSLVLVAIIPLTTVLQTNAIYRGPLGAVPYLCFLAALPLGYFWRQAEIRSLAWRWAAGGGIALALAAIAYTNLQAYFDDWAGSDLFPWVYTREMSAASEYAEAQPDDPYVYFFSGRWSFNYETRQYLAPDVAGEDRSREFGRTQDLAIDRGRDSLVLLLPPYLDLIKRYQALYPDGRRVDKRDGDTLLFIAYHLPAMSPSATLGRAALAP